LSDKESWGRSSLIRVVLKGKRKALLIADFFSISFAKIRRNIGKRKRMAMVVKMTQRAIDHMLCVIVQG